MRLYVKRKCVCNDFFLTFTRIYLNLKKNIFTNMKVGNNAVAVVVVGLGGSNTRVLVGDLAL